MNKELQDLDKLFNEKKWNQVVKKSKNLVLSNQVVAPYFNLLGLSLSQLGKNEDAEKFLLDGINKFPNEISLKSNIALIQILLKKLEDAQHHLNEALKLNKNDIHTLFAIGTLKREQDNLVEAAAIFKKICEKNVKFPKALTLLGQTYLDLAQETNKKEYYDLAEKNFIIHSELFPFSVGVDYVLSTFLDYSTNDFHQKKMLNKIKKLNLQDTHKPLLYFALGKSFEDQKKYGQAFEYIKIANEVRNKSVSKEVLKNEISKLRNIKKIFDNYNLKIEDTNELFQKKMIFIVGLPRSGTTLVHQILSSSDDTYGFGESIHLNKFFDKNIFDENFIKKIINKKTMNKELIKISNEIGNKYNSQSKKNIFIDKMPPNFYWIGFIKLIFPNSKIIHITRNIQDNCLSIYKNMFGAQDMDWSYSETNIIRFIINYKEVMKYWKSKFRNSIYELKYEKLVKNKNEETKNLYNFCDMEWNQNVLEFYKTAKTIRTVSINQVKKPIYQSSVNSSDNFKKYVNFLNKLNDI